MRRQGLPAEGHRREAVLLTACQQRSRRRASPIGILLSKFQEPRESGRGSRGNAEVVQTGSEVGVGEGGSPPRERQPSALTNLPRIKPGKQIRDSRNSGKFGCRSDATRETPPIGARCGVGSSTVSKPLP